MRYPHAPPHLVNRVRWQIQQVIQRRGRSVFNRRIACHVLRHDLLPAHECPVRHIRPLCQACRRQVGRKPDHFRSDITLIQIQNGVGGIGGRTRSRQCQQVGAGIIQLGQHIAGGGRALGFEGRVHEVEVGYSINIILHGHHELLHDQASLVGRVVIGIGLIPRPPKGLKGGSGVRNSEP